MNTNAETATYLFRRWRGQRNRFWKYRGLCLKRRAKSAGFDIVTFCLRRARETQRAGLSGLLLDPIEIFRGNRKQRIRFKIGLAQGKNFRFQIVAVFRLPDIT